MSQVLHLSGVTPEVLTERGIKQLTSRTKAERAQVGWGGGSSEVGSEGSHHCRTGKSNLTGWLQRSGEKCRWCGEGYEGGE